MTINFLKANSEPDLKNMTEITLKTALFIATRSIFS
jgi:hypothetical protein